MDAGLPMRAVRFYFTVDGKATLGFIEDPNTWRDTARSAVDSRLFRRLCLDSRFTGKRSLSRDVSPFIYSYGESLIATRSFTLFSSFLSPWPSSSPARVSAFNARRPPAVSKWYGNAATDKHQMQFRASTET